MEHAYEASQVVHQDDQDALWRCYALYCLQGSAIESLTLRSHSFIKLVRDCRLPPSSGMNDVETTVVYRRHATGNPVVQSMKTRYLHSQKVNREVPTKLGQNMNYEDFLLALVDMGLRCFPELTESQALTKIVFDHVLPYAYKEETRLPFKMSEKKFQTIVTEPEIMCFLDAWDALLLDIFNRCRPSKGPRGAGEQRWMLYQEFQKFCEIFLWLHSHQTTSLLSKYQIAQIFVGVKHGAGTGLMQRYISYSEFRTGLVLLAFAGAESERRLHPTVYIGDTLNSSASRHQDIHSHKLTHEHKEFDATGVNKLKWLLKRIFDCSERRDQKVYWLIPFKDAFSKMFKDDGRPASYLSPRATTTPQKKRETVTILRSPPRMSVGSGSDWIELRTEEGRPYYFHKQSSKVQWKKPIDGLVRIKAPYSQLGRQGTASQSPRLTAERRMSLMLNFEDQL